MTKRCVVCGKPFSAPPSSKKCTCSAQCSTARKQLSHQGKHNQWSEDARARLSQKGKTPNLQLGTEAAQKSPLAGRFETNQEAKIWTLITPTGDEIVVRNLLLWARIHTDLFDKPPGDRSANQIAHGFAAIAQTLRNTRKSPAHTYFGWSLKGPPEIPNDEPDP